jgi:hypothetical protein
MEFSWTLKRFTPLHSLIVLISRLAPAKLYIVDHKGTLIGYDFRPPRYTTYAERDHLIDATYFIKGNGLVEAAIGFPLQVP